METLDLLKQMIEVQLGIIIKVLSMVLVQLSISLSYIIGIPYSEQQILLNDQPLIDGNLLEIGLQSGSSIVGKITSTDSWLSMNA